MIAKTIKLIYALLLFSSIIFASTKNNVDDLTFNYLESKMFFKNNILTVSTGNVARTWKWTGKGLVTNSLKNIQTQKEWCNINSSQNADWSIPNQSLLPSAQLVGVTARESDDEGFTSKHLEVVADVFYPGLKTNVKYVIWAYPNSYGLRTQLLVKSDNKFTDESNLNTGIPISTLKVIQASSFALPATSPEKILDNDIHTFWQTLVSATKPLKPNYLVIDLGKIYNINGISITQKNEYNKLGWIEKFIVYASNDTANWGLPIGNGEMSRADYAQYFDLPQNRARYVKLVAPATTKINNTEWQTSMSELRIYSAEYPYKQQDMGCADYLPINCNGYKRTYTGYNLDQQFRNSLEYPFIKQLTNSLQINEKEKCNWANILTIENGAEGIALVKESPKTAIQQSYMTGEFICSNTGIENTGWGIAPGEFTNNYSKCWANWSIMFKGADEDREMSVKVFDRLRYPLLIPGRKQIYSNSWGFGNAPNASWRDKMDGGIESNVLESIKISKEMGIENYLIEIGYAETPDAPEEVWPYGHRPHPVYYPNGWEKVKKAAKENSISLSLWSDIGIKPEDLNWNQDRCQFESWKLDYTSFSGFNSHNDVEMKVRNFIKKYNYKVLITWDLTEIMPRYGLFWAREYGLIFPTNREQASHVLYTPSVALRDAWDLSKYLNVNQFQITVKNIRTVMAGSDANMYNQEYATAIGCVGIPLIYEKLQAYTTEEKQNIRHLLEQYKQERDAMFDSYAFPIGDRPDNASVTGFQYVSTNKNSGHILLFRELYSTQAVKEVQLRFIKNKQLKVYNVRTQKEFTLNVDDNGMALFNIEHPADFVFLRYEVRN